MIADVPAVPPHAIVIEGDYANPDPRIYVRDRRRPLLDVNARVKINPRDRYYYDDIRYFHYRDRGVVAELLDDLL